MKEGEQSESSLGETVELLNHIFTKLSRVWRRDTGETHSQVIAVESKAHVSLVAHKLPRTDQSEPPVQMAGSDSATLQEKLAHRLGDDLTEAVRYMDSDGRSSDVDIYRNGTITRSVRGESPQGEQGSFQVFSILVERLNQDGTHWVELEDLSQGGARQEGGVDCQARDGQEVLQVQVTKVAGGVFWRTLSQTHQAIDAKNINECVDELTRALEKKAKKLAGPHRASIVLALDARDTADYALTRVVEAFQQRYGAAVHQWGFRAIWVVGPTATLTKQLDV